MAEVGNPTIVATLTVVAALLPMLFVSGLMGPYMSPIPANASAAMIFSFFVAVIVTPWLMMKFGGGHGDGHAAAMARADGGCSGPHLSRGGAADPQVASARSWIFLLLVGVVTLGSLVLFYTKDVTVKLLPFDNKSELQVVVDLPEGSSVEATDRRAAARSPQIALTMPEVHSVQTYAGTPAPFNFNGLVRHYYVRSSPELGDVQITLAGKDERERTSHQIALELREKLKALDAARRHLAEGGRAAAGSAGAGNTAGRNLWSRCRNPPRHGGQGARGLCQGALRRRYRRQLWRAQAAHRASPSTRTIWNTRRSRKPTSMTRCSASMPRTPLAIRTVAVAASPFPSRWACRSRRGSWTSACFPRPFPPMRCRATVAWWNWAMW